MADIDTEHRRLERRLLRSRQRVLMHQAYKLANDWNREFRAAGRREGRASWDRISIIVSLPNGLRFLEEATLAFAAPKLGDAFISITHWWPGLMGNSVSVRYAIPEF